ncbi:MAG TPA: PAS domain-containing sensor histidine kinase [Kofleriaceae bacterium]
MAPNTAVMFVLSGTCLALSIPRVRSRARRWLAHALALLSGLLAALTLAAYVFGVDLGLARLILRASERTAPETALAFMLLASALLTLDLTRRRALIPVELLAMGALVLGALALGGYAYGAPQFYAPDVHRHPVGMAVHTSAGLIVLAIGVLCAAGNAGLMATVANPRLAGRVVRRVLAIVLVVPVVGFFAAWAQNTGLYDPPGATVITTVGGLVVAVLSALRLGHWLDRTDAERRRSDDRLRALRDWGEVFDHASFGAWLGSADGHLIRVNEAFARMHGCTRGAAEGRPLAEFFPEDRREELATSLCIVHDRGHHRWESENLRTDGSVFPVVIDSGAVYGRDGEVRYRATYVQDITEDKRAEAEGARLAAIVRSTDDAIVSTTLDGIVVDWNHAAERAFGYAADEMIGRSIELIVPEDRRAERRALIAKTMAGEPMVGVEAIRVCKDGQQIPVALTMSALRDSSGRASGISVIERDISVLKQLQREHEEWSAVVAHDLRQPASTIRFAAEMLRGLDGEPKQRVLVRVDHACGRLEQMIEDLLDVSRIEARRLVVRPSSLRVAPLLEEILDSAPDLARRCTVQVEDGAVEVWADAGRVSQVLSNLLSNADKYSYRGTRIDVHVARAEGMVEITVTNEGPGIEPDEIPLLFSRFARTRAARRGQAPGLGLGLYISSGLVEAQGGRMWVESTPGQRTSFHFTLPGAPPGKP